MSWRFDPRSFDRARRKEAYRRFARAVRKEDGPRDLLDLAEVEERLGLFERTYVGIQPVPVSQIIGSADRTGDFDRDFLPLKPEVKERWQEIERAFPQGDFPPIVVYEVDEAYFVIDGHHRVAVAKHMGVEFIDAEITRLHSRIALPADADIGFIILAEQARIFLERSGLGEARPDARIRLTRAHGYIELLELVEVHGFHLVQEQQRVLSPVEVAGDWYDRVYLPSVEAIKGEGLPEVVPDRTEGDLFLWVYQRRRALFPGRSDVTMSDAARDRVEDRRRAQKHRSPKR